MQQAIFVLNPPLYVIYNTYTSVFRKIFFPWSCVGAVPAGFADCKGDYLTGAFWDSWHIDSNCHQPDNTELFTNPFDSLPKESFMELDKVSL